MKLRLILTDTKGFCEFIDNVYKVSIIKKSYTGKKNILEIKFYNTRGDLLIPLSEVEQCFLIDIETMHEFFRYEK